MRKGQNRLFEPSCGVRWSWPLTTGWVLAAVLGFASCDGERPQPAVPTGPSSATAPATSSSATRGSYEPPIDTDPMKRVYAQTLLDAWAEARDAKQQARWPDDRAWTRSPIRVTSYRPSKATYTVTLDRAGQVLRLDVPDDLSYDDTPTKIYPSLAAMPGKLERFVPAAALGLKAKQFDDGLYAAVEYAMTKGAGQLVARAELLEKVLAALPTTAPARAGGVLAAASKLGGHPVKVSQPVQAEADELEKAFLADDVQSKPIGFYTWNQDLYRVFQRDRMLQTLLEPASATALAQAVLTDAQLRSTYEASLQLNARLTNPLARPSLRLAFEPLAAGQAPSFSTEDAAKPAFFPPSIAHETELFKKLFGNRLMPAGFNLADEMVKQIRDGRLDLKPRPTSGWYDHQTYALEPLVVPDKMPEGERLVLSKAYQRELVGLFKALLALTRETHIKQLEIPKGAGAAAGRPATKIELSVTPQLSVEPTASYYLRRAESYLFVRRVLEEAFGAPALTKMHRRTAAGPVNLNLDEELHLIEALLVGAYLKSCRQLGLVAQQLSGSRWAKRPDAAVALFDAWAGSVSDDPDLGTDFRMMVPVFFDLARGKTKVWAVLGVATKPLRVRFDEVPKVMGVEDAAGKPVDLAKVNVSYERETRQLAYLVSAEVFVDEILNREEFRRHCDKYQTFEQIVGKLK